MRGTLLLKAMGIWLVIVVAAIMNGTFREKVLVPAIGIDPALPLSGILLAVLVFLVTFMLISFIGSREYQVYLWVGVFWVGLTVSVEFLLGHFAGGKSWQEIMSVFNVTKGNLFVVVLLATAIAPWLAARARGVF